MSEFIKRDLIEAAILSKDEVAKFKQQATRFEYKEGSKKIIAYRHRDGRILVTEEQ